MRKRTLSNEHARVGSVAGPGSLAAPPAGDLTGPRAAGAPLPWNGDVTAGRRQEPEPARPANGECGGVWRSRRPGGVAVGPGWGGARAASSQLGVRVTDVSGAARLAGSLSTRPGSACPASVRLGSALSARPSFASDGQRRQLDPGTPSPAQGWRCLRFVQ